MPNLKHDEKDEDNKLVKKVIVRQGIFSLFMMKRMNTLVRQGIKQTY